MNWMTSAKNRLQRSNKAKSNNNLRMKASSKLPPSQNKNSIIMHNFNPPNRREEARQTKVTESNDIWMLNNLSRNRMTRVEAQTQYVPISSPKNTSRVAPFDPLQDLDVTPSKSSLHHENIVEEQQITFYNDGHLCDELGNLILTNTTAVQLQHAPKVTNRETSRRLFGPVSDRTPPESRAGQDRSNGPGGSGKKIESPEDSLGSTDSEDWWHRLITMLAHSTMAENYLHTVLAEIVPVSNLATIPSIASVGTSALLQAAEGLEPPSAREVLDALYRALSKVGRDQRSSLIVFDAIRMLEIVDKQQNEPHNHRNSSTRASSTTPSFLHTNTKNNNNNNHKTTLYSTLSPSNISLKHSQVDDHALDLDSLLSDTHYHSHKENHPTSSSHSNIQSNDNLYIAPAVSVTTAHADGDELDWNLFDAPITSTANTTSHATTTAINANVFSNAASAIPGSHSHTITKPSVHPEYRASSVYHNVSDDKSVGMKRKATSSTAPQLQSFSNNADSSKGDMELRLEDLF